ncbi:hypothetical protein COEREDRAFT_13849 [Coemansia reversa NRRL 1564]|uniref:Nuclear speckle splicing regulatory protein 1 N-terminal domain-containing protein n=1 Tax=Coemansia reversa (strain ATCC 12441 / NRRL 1564) TaxID=763665 RepID=A0A2G5BGY6_COERN|nr:hypothetical protein COEREDRAFT_13849 [Coemansia reversa NRRL 1564]|eukprot:PIA18284.1 hypothetical protein COEREDRAFT_13849 [Coemansia reversa NRRL 1564]
MRKSTSLKVGLNLRKPGRGTTSTPQNTGNSVFSEQPYNEQKNNEATTNIHKRQHDYPGSTQTRESAKLASELETSDPTIFAYDELYDSISSNSQHRRDSRSSQKSADSRPRYMEKLIETAKQRKVHAEVAREKMLAKTREREGDEFADKESFVTAAYKEQKEQRQRLVEEEEAKEKEMSTSNSSRPLGFGMMGPAAFSRQFLDRVEQEGAKKAAILAGVDFPKCNTGQNNSTTSNNDSSNHESKDVALSAGLNIVGRVGSQSKPTSNRQFPTTTRKDVEQTRESVDKQRSLDYRGNYRPGGTSDKPMWADVESHEREKLAAQDRERQLLIARYSRRNNDASIDAARQRYLERKQARL